MSSGFLTSFSLLFLLQHISLPTPSRLCVDAGSSQDHRSSGQSLSQGWPESTFQEASRANINYRPNRDTLSAECSVVNNKAGTRGINQECPRYMFVSVTNLISEKSGVTLRLALLAKILGSSTTGSPTNHCLCVVWALATCSADRGSSHYSAPRSYCEDHRRPTTITSPSPSGVPLVLYDDMTRGQRVDSTCPAGNIGLTDRVGKGKKVCKK